MALETKVQTYRTRHDELLSHEGKFVVIKGTDIVGFFDTYADAVQSGYDQFGLETFLVKQIQEIEQVLSF